MTNSIFNNFQEELVIPKDTGFQVPACFRAGPEVAQRERNKSWDQEKV
jgi:hypothetical protein